MTARLLALSLFVLPACSEPVPRPSVDAGVPDALREAHQAWLDDDLETVSAQVQAVLESEVSPAVEDNALELLEAAFQRQPALPSRQRLPDGVRTLSLDHVHSVGPEGHRFRLLLRAHATSVDVIDGMAFSGPGVDSTSATFSNQAEPGQAYAELELPDGPLPAPRGAYHLTVTVDGVDHPYWVALTDHTASEVPTVLAPYPGQIVSDVHPLIQTDPKATPEHLVGERASNAVWLARRPDFTFVWGGNLPSSTEGVRVEPALTDGPYWLAVSRRETRSLGPVTIGRVARRGVPFTVRAKPPGD